jgi:hypothetical protein
VHPEKFAAAGFTEGIGYKAQYIRDAKRKNYRYNDGSVFEVAHVMHGISKSYLFMQHYFLNAADAREKSALGSQADILPQFSRAAAMRREAAPQAASWRQSQYGQERPLAPIGNYRAD